MAALCICSRIKFHKPSYNNSAGTGISFPLFLGVQAFQRRIRQLFILAVPFIVGTFGLYLFSNQNGTAAGVELGISQRSKEFLACFRQTVPRMDVFVFGGGGDTMEPFFECRAGRILLRAAPFFTPRSMEATQAGTAYLYVIFLLLAGCIAYTVKL